MAGDIKNRRRNYFIKKKFQAKFILKFCTLVVIGAALSGAIIYAMSSSTLTTTFEGSRLAIKSTADYILPAVLLASAIVIVLIGLAAIAVTLFTSHRIAGPLYRMEKDVQEVASGNLAKRFNLRQGDELKLLAASLDAMAQKLRGDVAGIKEAIAEAEAAAVNVEKATSAQAVGDLKARLERLKKVIAKLNT